MTPVMTLPLNYTLAAIESQKGPIVLFWALLPILAYVLIRRNQNRKPSLLWIILMLPFGWFAFIVAMILNA